MRIEYEVVPGTEVHIALTLEEVLSMASSDKVTRRDNPLKVVEPRTVPDTKHTTVPIKKEHGGKGA